jgi:hypothetical protein
VRLECCGDAHSLVELARTGQIAAAVISLRDASDRSHLPLLAALREAAPTTPVVGVLGAESRRSSDIALAVRAGMHALIVPELGDA